MSFWIWYPGDFAIRHGLKLNSRREEFGLSYPVFWRLDDCWHNVQFRRTLTLEKPEEITVHLRGMGCVLLDGVRCAPEKPLMIPAGKHEVRIDVCRMGGLPSAYVEGDSYASGAGWESSNATATWLPCEYSSMYTDPADDPETFQFAYEPIEPVRVIREENGTLYDFGRQTFAKVIITEIHADGDIRLCFGESETEARDVAECYIHDDLPLGTATHETQARAFRYIYVSGTAELKLNALYEYLPFEERGQFASSDQQLCDLWRIAAYTFHLNSREFFLDGIKRDRWVWSGDAYQSFFVNRCLYMDQDIVKRTLWTLRGKDPIEQHINTILDYSLYWVMSVSDYYDTFGDLDFVRAVWPRLKGLMDYCCRSVNADGFLIGQPTDWVFVDWADMDKTGAVCAEQMLFITALKAAARCAQLLGEDGSAYLQQAGEVRARLDDFFYDQEKGCYIDSYESRLRNVTRHANTFALLFDIADEEQKLSIIRNVLDNDAVPPITTPYFKFFELWAACKLGRTQEAMRRVRDYWGGMIDLGATTIWEEFDPRQDFPRHYEMYNQKYGKSLCHAWGAGPIYLMSRYIMGLAPTAPGYATFDISPDPAGISDFSGVLPLPDGEVRIALKDGHVTARASRAGGTLRWQGQSAELPAGVDVTL